MTDPNYEAKKAIFDSLKEKGLMKWASYDEFKKSQITEKMAPEEIVEYEKRQSYLNWKKTLGEQDLKDFNTIFSED